ncbi:unnamed protein product [Brassicogethes aeneus]|uniref:Ubiquinone biosynthesis protein COQ4 homolog, mitochondrial n=1 Tax=Brassicogethes aeneus TaxID=1431903 RepID=A0A9P0BJ90_BRAAE|nr:unnamed protein product [Brassicogethes aeneus]
MILAFNKAPRRLVPLINQALGRNLASFEDDYNRNHVQLNVFQKSALAVGSAALSILDPYRGDMIATLSETTGEDALVEMHEIMLNSHEGYEILSKKPRINSRTVDLEYLKKLPEGTLGKTYSNFLVENNVTPDSRMPVEFVDNIELAYVIQRYRETHDLFHTVLCMPTHMLGEVTVKWVEAIQTKLPMCIGGAIFGAGRLKPKHRKLYTEKYLPWAIKTGKNMDFLLNIYFEKRWEQNVHELCQEINMVPLKLEE